MLMKSHRQYFSQRGNVLFLILIAVGLFGVLSYVVTRSTSTSPGDVEAEKQKLDQAVLNNCESDINLALMRLRNLSNCSDDEINYELPDGSNANPNAPVDDHCNVFHPSYGGASPCGLLMDPACDLTILSVGESCGAVVYAGESGGNRLYTTRADHSNGVTWDNGTGNFIDTGATSTVDGAGNTDTLVSLVDADAPYMAAQLCRSFGEDWYLPSRDEFNLLYANRTAIGGFYDENVYPRGFYWSSSEVDSDNAWGLKLFGNIWYDSSKDDSYSVRCVRQD